MQPGMKVNGAYYCDVFTAQTVAAGHLPSCRAPFASRAPRMHNSTSSSSRMRVIYHNWSATKQRPHPQSVAEISRHSVLSGDRIRQCETSSGSRHKDTDQCLIVASTELLRHKTLNFTPDVASQQTKPQFCRLQITESHSGMCSSETAGDVKPR